MKFSYEATLADVAEPSVHLFLRSNSYLTTRWRGAALCAGVFAVFAWLGFHAKETVNIVVICLAAAAWGAGLFLLTYKGSVRRRIASYVATELKGTWPRRTDIELTGNQLISTTSGASTTFKLSDLVSVFEDAKHLELNFGPRGLWVIPKCAFESTDAKTAFLAALEN